MRFGVRAQFFVPLLAVLLVMLAVIAVAVWDTIRRERSNLHVRLDDIITTIDHAHFPLTQAVLQQMKGLTGAEFFLHQSQHEPVGTLAAIPNSSEIENRFATHVPSSALEKPIEFAGQQYFSRMWKRPAVNKAGEGLLIVLYPVSRWNDTVSAAVRPLVIFGIGGMVLATALTLLLGNRMVARIHDLKAQSQRIAKGDFQPMPLPSRQDELRDLAQSVNEMAEQLKTMQTSLRDGERWRVLGQMSGGLAHQMRNGVTGAKLALQLDERENEQSEPLQVVKRQLTLIEMQLQRFLELGAGSEEPASDVDVADVAVEASALLQPRCRHLGIHWNSDIAHNLPVIRTERGGVLQLLVNLLDNAMDACGPGGIVDLKVAVIDNTIEIEVSDNGPGPKASVASNLFDPFVTGKPDGIGLGLAVVRKVVDGLHGQVKWDRDAGRTRFLVRIPIDVAKPVSNSNREYSFA